MGTETPQRPRKEAAGSRHEPGLVHQTAPASPDPIGPQTQTLLEEVLRRENLRTALTRVQSNKGAPGVDGMRVEDLPAYLRTEWHAIREQAAGRVLHSIAGARGAMAQARRGDADARYPDGP